MCSSQLHVLWSNGWRTLFAGEVYGRYVPQSVSNKDGQAQDIDIVVNELFGDSDEVFVEYSNGPMPYRVRWVLFLLLLLCQDSVRPDG